MKTTAIDDQTKNLVDQFAEMLCRFALTESTNPTLVAKEFSDALIKRGRLRKLPQRSMGTSADKLTRAFHEWNTNPTYLDKSGLPIALPLSGRRLSIESLIDKYGRSKTKNSLHEIINSDAITKTNNGKFLPRKSYFDCKHSELLYRHHVCVTTLRFFHTVNKNVSRRATFIERTAAIADLPVEVEKDFRSFSTKQGESLVKTISKWLENNRTKSTANRGKSKKTVNAGVHIFSFAEPNPIPRRRKTRRGD